uniref:Transmembrane channel-like protein n=1 Tax=Callorhinchus milii TaxID=7868 RepID=A0A4W3JUV2_CALMI|eukprot:gi/632943174/ref/XP_007886811.1/ PREDICTED: transmembrane channel-like protein 6 isoform X2 [Callorhinchus milii]
MSRHVSFNPDLSPDVPGCSASKLSSSDAEEIMMHESFHHLRDQQSGAFVTEVEMEQLGDTRTKELVCFLSPNRKGTEGEDLYECYDAATLKVLSSMPSRTIGRSRGAIISEYCNRTLKLRKRKTRPSVKEISRSMRPSIRDQSALDDRHEEEAEKKRQLVRELENITESQRNKILQEMPLCLSMKLDLRNQVTSKGCFKEPQERRRLHCCSHIKYSLMFGAQRRWYGFLSFLHSLQLWQMTQKQISGRFGMGVLSYFIFLKILLMFNIFLFALNLLFIVIPQATQPPAVTQSKFTGLELLTGAGKFTETILYYGYYTNSSLNSNCTTSSCFSIPYNMPIAYVYTLGAAFFITCIILVYSVSKAFGESFRVGSTYRDLAVKLFCSWDFKVTQKKSIEVQYENISTQLKEILSDLRTNTSRLSTWEKLRNIAIHMFGWLICFGSAIGCAIGVYYFSEQILEDYTDKIREGKSKQELDSSLLALPIVVSFINLVLPYFYNLIGSVEKYELPQLQVYVAITRNLVLKMSSLGLLCYHWLGGNTRKQAEIPCWETFVGQELYRLVVVDFIFIVLDTIFGEFVWRLISMKLHKKKPEFDIARNVLELIYGQTLIWLGLLYSPLLPAIQIIKFLFVFYIKKHSLMRNCEAPSKRWGASHMMTVFITLLCFPSFLGAVVAYTYTIWSIKPSNACGPFRSLNTIYESAKNWVNQLAKTDSRLYWFSYIHRSLVDNPFIFLVGSAILMIVIYFHWQVVDGQRKIIKLLYEQIANEGEDKKFLINKLKGMNSKKSKSAKQRQDHQEEDEVFS